MRFYVLFNSVSVISGRWEVDNNRLCAMELGLRLDVKNSSGVVSAYAHSMNMTKYAQSMIKLLI